MRIVLGLLVGMIVLGLGFWAYQENYRTRAALAELRDLQRNLVALHEERTILRAEWAWLNRPERLQVLVRANKAELQLMDMVPEHFGHLDQVAFPVQSVFAGRATVPPDATVRPGAADAAEGAEVIQAREAQLP